MQFQVSFCVEGVDDIATKTVDTKTDLQAEVITFCERWLGVGGEKGDPWSQRPVILSVVDRNASAILLGFVIQRELSAFMFAISGKDGAADQATVKQFRERCQQAGWNAEHAAHQVPAPGYYLMSNPMHNDIQENVIMGLQQIADHLAAAFFNQVGLPV